MATKYNPILIDLLKIMAKIRVISDNHAYRFFDETERGEVTATLRNALERKIFGTKIVLVPEPSDGKVRGRSGRKVAIRIYYLLEPGKRMIERYWKKGSDFVRCGQPIGIHKGRIYHDLLIVESLLWFFERFTVVDFINEDQLRSDDDVLADLRVITIENDKHRVHDCEIVVQNSRQQIEGKSDHLIWFSPSVRQCDAIESIKKAPVIHLNLQHQQPQKQHQAVTITGNEQLVLNLIGIYGGALTAPAVAKRLRKDPGQTNVLVKGLEAKGLLFTASVQANPGISPGRPAKLFAISPMKITTLNDRLHALEVSKNAIDCSNP
jgi:hypothetical protein